MTATYAKSETTSYHNQRHINNKLSMSDMAPPTYNVQMPPTQSYQNDTIADEKIPVANENKLQPSVTSVSTSSLTGRKLQFHHASFPWRSVNITNPTTNQPAYYAEISEATPNKPDILLRAPNQSGSSVGRAHFRLSRSMRMGLGADELDEKGLQWTEFKSSSLFSKGAYDFECAGRSYRLQRTRSRENGVEGVMQRSMNLGHFKVVEVAPLSSRSGEAGEGRVVAAYVSETYHPAWMKGTLTFASDEMVDRGLEVLIVMGVVGWREKMRRRAAYSGNGGNGGGG